MATNHKLRLARTLIDRTDAAIVALAGLRQRATCLAARAKATGAARDHAREAAIHQHVRKVALDVGLPVRLATALVDLLIADSCRVQGLDTTPSELQHPTEENPMDVTWPHRIAAFLLPHPSRVKPLVSLIPRSLLDPALSHIVSKAFKSSLAAGDLAFLEGRSLAITISDIDLRWIFGLRNGQITTVTTPAESEVCGTATDLLLLASRQADADTLFFQRRLTVTGDTELGLLARNTLDRIEWDTLPLGQRILLHRLARHAASVRTAWHLRNQAPANRAAPVVPVQ